MGTFSALSLGDIDAISPAVSETPKKQANDNKEQQLLKWTAHLPAQSEAMQMTQLEAILTKLSVETMDDMLRLRLMEIVLSALQRLFAQLRKHYIYEVGPLNAEQQHVVASIKSLCYLSIAVYDGMINRLSAASDQALQQPRVPKGWRKFMFSSTEPSPTSVALNTAIYQCMGLYQRLVFEKTLCYQSIPKYVWSALNRLYLTASLYHVAHTDISKHVASAQPVSIHQRYSQLCLHALLNTLAMRRPNLLLLQKLLPEWSKHSAITFEPQTRTRLFVNLHSDQPPEYLTSASTINPYKEDSHCLFIEIEPFMAYLQAHKASIETIDDKINEYRLVNEVLSMLKHRYTHRQLAPLSQATNTPTTKIITGFDNIHYHAAGQRSLMALIAPKSLSVQHLPIEDTKPQSKPAEHTLDIALPEHNQTDDNIKTLRLLTAQDIVKQHAAKSAASKEAVAMPPIFTAKTVDYHALNDNAAYTNLLATAPPRLKNMSLFLLDNDNNAKNWSLGVVHWLTIDETYVEAEAQIIGHRPTACALRLDQGDTRNQRFVPALLLGRDNALQTSCSILVPSYQFKSQDRVIIRLQDKQTPLRLQRRLLTTERFTQFEVAHL
ncbi:hypothetical protein [Psychrobacter aestuarii]|uniref:GTPase n=1 Tax=Psychrobacter aestuarii TaxID=556327 RepID=A0ABN0VMI0_9GAMM|nr:hypothetical protein [Psychrobacter aestuarii]